MSGSGPLAKPPNPKNYATEEAFQDAAANYLAFKYYGPYFHLLAASSTSLVPPSQGNESDHRDKKRKIPK